MLLAAPFVGDAAIAVCSNQRSVVRSPHEGKLRPSPGAQAPWLGFQKRTIGFGSD